MYLEKEDEDLLLIDEIIYLKEANSANVFHTKKVITTKQKSMP